MSRFRSKSRYVLAAALGLLAILVGSAHGAEPADGRIVRLPPFITETSGPPLHWRYGRFNQFEVLSLCSDRVTREYMRQLLGLEQQMSWILPPDFRYRTSLPITYVLCGETMRSRLDRDIPERMNHEQGDQAYSDQASPMVHFRANSNLHLQDDDASAIFAIVDEQALDKTQLFYLPAAMEGFLRQRTPLLPSWFTQGFMYLYDRMLFSAASRGPIRVSIPPFVWISGEFRPVHFTVTDASGLVYYEADTKNACVNLVDTAGHSIGKWTGLGFPSGLCYVPEDNAIYVCDARLNRITKVGLDGKILGTLDPSDIEKKLYGQARFGQLANSGDPAEPIIAPLLPMGDLFAAPHPPAGPSSAIDRYNQQWICQAALFVLFGLEPGNRGPLDPAQTGPVDPNDHTWRDSFWKFVAKSSAGPVTETMLQDCFGLNYEQMRGKISRFVCGTGVHLHNIGSRDRNPPSIASFVLRDASGPEVSAIKGDWERLEAAFIKSTYPELRGTYLDQAHRTLSRAFDLGSRDPRLLAALGLYECDAGDDLTARPLLAAAVQANVIRPKAYFELARIRYAEALANPAGLKGKLSTAQATSILLLLAEARKQSPPLLSAYELFTNLWFHSDLTPSKADLAELNEGPSLFSKSPALIFQTAMLDAQAGLLPEANRLIDHGLEIAPDDDDKARFFRLRALLANAGSAR